MGTPLCSRTRFFATSGLSQASHRIVESGFCLMTHGSTSVAEPFIFSACSEQFPTTLVRQLRSQYVAQKTTKQPQQQQQQRAAELTMTESGFQGCCGSTRFAREMSLRSPFASLDLAKQASQDIWWNKVDVSGWLEAFAAHPRIGDVDALRTKFASERFCSGEQEAALNSANDQTLHELADWNRKYEAKFGFVFLICAAGKSSSEILAALKDRYSNRPIDELQKAAAEQQKITELRLAKLMSSDSTSSETATSDTPKATSDGKQAAAAAAPSSTAAGNLRPPITTHVLDVSLGKPGTGIDVALHVWTKDAADAHADAQTDAEGRWAAVGSSVTNSDGRSGALLAASSHVDPGKYRLTFHTGPYLARVHGGGQRGSESGGAFYPEAVVVFEVQTWQAAEHFHIPLLLAPFSFSTYRGS